MTRDPTRDPRRSRHQSADHVVWLGHRPIHPSGGDCLDETTIALFVDHALDRPAAAGLVAHIDACADCRRLIAALARRAQVPAE